MSVEVIQNLNKVATPQIKKYIAEVHQGTSASVSVTDIGLAKGDLIGFRGAGDPVRIQAGGINGRVLMVDSTKESGWAVSPVSGSSQSVTLHNGLGEIIPGGTIVKISSGYELAKATSSDTTMLFVTSEDCQDDADVVCYGTANTLVSIRCTEDTVAVGDQLGVSSTDGVAETVESNGFARAITAKSTGAGTVNALIAQAGFLPLTGGELTGNLSASGDISASNLSASGDATVGDDLSVTGDVSVSGDLSVSGDATLTNPLTIANGGTGATTASGACANLGLGDSGWITLNTTIPTYYRKKSGIVEIVMPGRNINQGSHTLGTLPVGYRPKWYIEGFPMVSMNGSAAAQLNMSVDADGVVKVFNNSGYNPGWFVGRIIYIAEA